MQSKRPLLAGAAAALIGAALCQTAQARPLDLTTDSSIALGAAKAAQAGAAPQGRAAPTETATSAPATGDTVQGVTVRPEARPQGRVVASTDAAPLTSPDFTAADAAPPPLAFSVARGVAFGAQGEAEDGITVRDPLEFDRLGTVGLTAVF